MSQPWKNILSGLCLVRSKSLVVSQETQEVQVQRQLVGEDHEGRNGREVVVRFKPDLRLAHGRGVGIRLLPISNVRRKDMVIDVVHPGIRAHNHIVDVHGRVDSSCPHSGRMSLSVLPCEVICLINCLIPFAVLDDFPLLQRSRLLQSLQRRHCS